MAKPDILLTDDLKDTLKDNGYCEQLEDQGVDPDEDPFHICD